MKIVFLSFIILLLFLLFYDFLNSNFEGNKSMLCMDNMDKIINCEYFLWGPPLFSTTKINNNKIVFNPSNKVQSILHIFFHLANNEKLLQNKRRIF